MEEHLYHWIRFSNHQKRIWQAAIRLSESPLIQTRNMPIRSCLPKPAMAAIWVDQYTGRVISKYERAEIFKLASAAHRRLFGKSKAEGASGAKTGKLIIGISTIALLLIILSGLIVWWPAKRQCQKKFTISTDKGSYRFWFDFHCVGGVISTLVLVVCILTGLNWSFGWYRTAFTQP